MKLLEIFKNTYDKGDNVLTALGAGQIVDTIGIGTPDQHIMFFPDEDSQRKFNLEAKPYKMSYSEIKKHI